MNCLPLIGNCTSKFYFFVNLKELDYSIMCVSLAKKCIKYVLKIQP